MTQKNLVVLSMLAVIVAIPLTWKMIHQSSDVDYWGDAVSEAPFSVKNHWFFGAALLDHGQPKEAEQQFRAILKINPNNFSTQLYLGEALFAQDRKADACELWSKIETKNHPDWRRQVDERLARCK